MSHAAPGRHRAPAPDARPFPWVVAVAMVAGVALAIGAVAFLWPDPAPSQGAADPPPSVTGIAPTPSPSAAAAIESSRVVTVEGSTVTIEEVSELVEGESAQAEPTRGVPLGLRLVSTAVVTADGRAKAFDAPITLTASGALTVRNRYRLTGCPDVLPTQWPSPAEFPDATRTYLRLDGPLHTASALCPRATSQAQRLPGLTGVLVEGDAAAVRLTWKGSGDLTVAAIGSASGVAALATDPRCDTACVAIIANGGSELLQFQPVDPCPPATTSESLVLVLGGPGDGASVVSVPVRGLARTVCR